ncbi:MAG TPA: EpsD family peptidyl-prolyl cis-trans isomerase [Burkholderiaceae bacterium]|nr:EpsD family peptidyl-prolyl cis-trans isomerase [Burkholderiaceae bacterium]
MTHTRHPTRPPGSGRNAFQARRSSRAPVRALVLCAMLAACSQQTPATSSTQVVARVNGTEITVHQLNALLQRLPNPQQAGTDAARQEALRRLIDAELLRQQAVAEKLDRKPEIVQAMEATRTEVLASGYLQSVVGRIAPPSDDDIARFYRERPELFAQRKALRLIEMNIPQRADLRADLAAFLPGARGLDEVRAWLKARGVADVPATTATRTTDQFPGDAGRTASALKERALFAFTAGPNLTIAQVESISAATVPEAAARPLIVNHLTAPRRSAATRAEIERLRAAATIEDLSELSKGARGEPPAPAARQSGAAPDDAMRASVDRGVKALK